MILVYFTHYCFLQSLKQQQAHSRHSIKYLLSEYMIEWSSLAMKEKKLLQCLYVKIWAAENQVNLNVLRFMFKTPWKFLLYHL